MKKFSQTVLMASLLIPSTVAVAADRMVSFKIEEPLPEGHAAWLLSYKTDDVGHDVKIEHNQWSSSFLIEDATPRILVGACHDTDCIGMKVMGEIPPLKIVGAEGEMLISSLLLGDMTVAFEIRVRWSSPGG